MFPKLRGDPRERTTAEGWENVVGTNAVLRKINRRSGHHSKFEIQNKNVQQNWENQFRKKNVCHKIILKQTATLKKNSATLDLTKAPRRVLICHLQQLGAARRQDEAMARDSGVRQEKSRIRANVRANHRQKIGAKIGRVSRISVHP